MKLINKNCLDWLSELPENHADLCIADLPFGTTQSRWDSQIDLNDFWPKLWRVLKPNAPVLCFGSQPFTSILVNSQINYFRYEWIWEKSKASNFLDCKKKPLKAHESILVFCREATPYCPQMTQGEAYKARPGKKITEVYGVVKDNKFRNDNEGLRYPRSVIYFKTAESEGKVYHSAQKPASLIEYFLKTYTKEGDIIIDPTAGSGTTLVAANNLKREALGCELNKEIYEIAKARLGI